MKSVNANGASVFDNIIISKHVNNHLLRSKLSEEETMLPIEEDMLVVATGSSAICDN
jgi:hypothetical protein